MDNTLTFEGMRIYCSDKIWEEHILPKHPYALLHKKYFPKAITNPTSVRLSRQDNTVRIHYYPIGTDFFKIVIKVRRDDKDIEYGEVITAYIDNKIDRKDKEYLHPKK